ncbi:MAG: tetratricopeptide repeat protein, partial [Verrucomicrobia bacterium]|nr:tetratricopeptide repeat protein [Verrucomicrobiota bacterium]
RQAQARLKQGNFNDAVKLLSDRQRDAGKLADEYQFWIGEAQFQNPNFPAAAAAYAKLVKDFPNSARFGEAAYAEALAQSKIPDWPRVISLLQQTGGAFAKFAAANPAGETVARGSLLLGEAQFALKDFSGAEQAVRALAGQKLNPELDWRRQFLLCRIQLANDQPAEALAGATNLLALAAAAGKRDLQAETALLQGGVLERLKKFDEAIAAYETNLAADLPVERRRQAVLKIVELLLARNKTAAATKQLEKFIGQYGKDKAADTALLTVGELHLREYLANRVANSNDWAQAAAQFDLVAANYPRSPVLGKALLNRAWCWWVVTNLAESAAAFQQAAVRAPLAEDQALARFKWADCQFQSGDAAGALTNYNFVIEKFSAWPAVRDGLVEPALYQIVRASLAVGNTAGATNALAKILSAYPAGSVCDCGMLLTGEKLNRTGDPAAARRIFTAALEKFPKSPLAPETRLAVARTFEQEQNWPAAIAEYDRWLADFAGHEARPRAEFARAWDLGRTGEATNALAFFANFAAHFPTNELAPLAQNWVADFYLQRGDYKNAEANYQLLFQKWPATPVTYQAQLMAGRAAVARLGYADAAGYFTRLINDLSCPAELVAQAYFEYGDAMMRMDSTDTNKPFANFEEAIVIFGKIPQKHPASDLVAPAWGRIGDCYLQLATVAPKYY